MKGAIYFVAIATVIFSHVKISSFRAKAHLVFHWCLYDKKNYGDLEECYPPSSKAEVDNSLLDLQESATLLQF